MPNEEFSKIPFISKSLESAVSVAFSNEISGQIRTKQEALLDPNNSSEFQHGKQWASPANDVGDQSGVLEPHSFEMSVHMKEVVAGNPAVIFNNVDKVASGMHNSIERMMFSKLAESAEISGNVVNAGEHGSFPEAFAQMLEKIEMSIDEDGNLQLPTIAVGPEQGEKLMKTLQAAGPEFDKRIDEIKERKRIQALERERLRVERFDRRAT